MVAADNARAALRPPTPAEVIGAGCRLWGADRDWRRWFSTDTQEVRVYKGHILFAGANRRDLQSKPPPWSASRSWLRDVDGVPDSGAVTIGSGDAASIPLAKEAAESAVDEYLAGLVSA